jgi:hypothetical protein
MKDEEQNQVEERRRETGDPVFTSELTSPNLTPQTFNVVYSLLLKYLPNITAWSEVHSDDVWKISIQFHGQNAKRNIAKSEFQEAFTKQTGMKWS